jgi:hypothetical protein
MTKVFSFVIEHPNNIIVVLLLAMVGKQIFQEKVKKVQESAITSYPAYGIDIDTYFCINFLSFEYFYLLFHNRFLVINLLRKKFMKKLPHYSNQFKRDEELFQ